MGDTDRAELQSKMGKIKYTLGATISVGNYSNLQPSIEVEADTFEEAQAQAMPHIEKVWAQYGEKPLTSKTVATSNREKLKAFAGGDIWFDPIAHEYTNDKGEVYLSGSQYAKKFEKPFEANIIASKIASKFNVSAGEVLDMWQLKSEVSSGFGTAIHASLQLYEQYGELAKAMEKTTHLHDHPIIKQAVESFFNGRPKEDAECEALIVDHTNKRAGRIDRLLILDREKKIARIQDYKTNVEMPPAKLKVYYEQLGFYKGIMEADGWTINGLDIMHYNGKWTTHSKES